MRVPDSAKHSCMGIASLKSTFKDVHKCFAESWPKCNAPYSLCMYWKKQVSSIVPAMGVGSDKAPTSCNILSDGALLTPVPDKSPGHSCMASAREIPLTSGPSAAGSRDVSLHFLPMFSSSRSQQLCLHAKKNKHCSSGCCWMGAKWVLATPEPGLKTVFTTVSETLLDAVCHGPCLQFNPVQLHPLVMSLVVNRYFS